MSEDSQLPKYTDEEFERKSREAWDIYRCLREEALRNPSRDKISRLVHDITVLTDTLPMMVTNDDETIERLACLHRDNRLGTKESREAFNHHIRERAATRYMWPCVVSVVKGLSKKFPRSKNNDSELEVFLEDIQLGSALPAKRQSVILEDGKLTFSGLVMNEIEGINMRLSELHSRANTSEKILFDEHNKWMNLALNLEPLTINNVTEWAEVIFDKQAYECSHELVPLLVNSYNSTMTEKGGKTYEEGGDMTAYAKLRIRIELKKYTP